jgi:class 3 adenylate cyclase
MLRRSVIYYCVAYSCDVRLVGPQRIEAVTKPAIPIKRRLAAIFCADVAAYARLMSIDETGTLYLLNAHNQVGR